MRARDDTTLLQFLRPARTVRASRADVDLGRLVARTRSRLAGVCAEMPRDLLEQLVMDVVLFEVKWEDSRHLSLFDRA